MAVKNATYLANLVANTERGPSEAIWGFPGAPNAWVPDFIQDPRLGMQIFDDFLLAGQPGSAAAGAVVGDFGMWSIYLGSTATITDQGIVGAAPAFTPGTAASNNPVVISGQVGAFQITAGTNTSNLQQKLAFEARVLLQSVTASKRDAFIGLADQYSTTATFPITAGTGTNQLTSTRNLIGFYNAYSGGGQDWGFVYQLASTAPVFCTNLQSLVSSVTGTAIAANTWYKLGFTYDPNAASQTIVSASTGQTVGTISRGMLKVFVNGQPAAAFLTMNNNILATNFPTGIMTPTVAIMNEVSSVGASTNAGLLAIDWLRVAQSAIT